MLGPHREKTYQARLRAPVQPQKRTFLLQGELELLQYDQKKDQRKQRNEYDLVLTTRQVLLLFMFHLILTMNSEMSVTSPLYRYEN